MQNIIRKIGICNNFDAVLKESVELVSMLDSNQISVQVADNSEDWFCSSGRQANASDEFLYKDIHPALKGSAIEAYINSLGLELYRTRILRMKPKTSYSTHKDPTPRIHLPLVINPQAAFLFPDDNFMFQMLHPGEIFWCDTRHKHTYVNWSEQDRIHMVSVVKE